MQLTLRDMLNSKDALISLGREKLPGKLAYTLARNMRRINDELEAYDEARVKMIKEKYGAEGEAGIWTVKPENTAAFNEELNQLMETQVEVDIRRIRFEDLPAEMTPLTLMALEYMITEPSVE